MRKVQDEDARQNERRRRIAEELIAIELRKRKRARTEEALLDAARSIERIDRRKRNKE